MCPDFESRHFSILDSKALKVFNDGERNNNFMVLYKTIIPNYLKKLLFLRLSGREIPDGAETIETIKATFIRTSLAVVS